jgi:glycosyltransferase involved in cell wall biosynthesis
VRAAIITRSNLYDVPGGDTVQIVQTAKHLKDLGVNAEICLTSGRIDYTSFDLFHFFNITRPSDILFHVSKIKKPYVVSPILVDYSEYDRQYRKGLSGFIFRNFSSGTNEYIKTFSRWIAGNNSMQSKAYIWKGQQRSIREILNKAALLLPNSEAEYRKLEEVYKVKKKYFVVPNGIDPTLFGLEKKPAKDNKLVLCASRIEGIKNQWNLIKALNNTDYTLIIIGSPAPNQKRYFEACKKLASKNIIFQSHVSQIELAGYYKRAKVHALPSWFETCGLSSLEAAAMGCNVMITEKGFTREYFGDEAYYCDPGDPQSIYHGIEKAAKSDGSKNLQEKILNNFTWQRAAALTSMAYQKIMST